MQEEKFYEELLGLSLLRINWVEKQPGKLVIHCEYQSEGGHCPQCGSVTAVVNQYDNRQVRDLDISGKQVWLDIRVAQFVCHTCCRYFTESPAWVEPGKSYTKRQAKWVFDMCAKQPFTEVGALVDMNHKTVERLYFQQAEVQVNLAQRYREVRKIGIDELAHRKGKQDYVCVLTDLERGIQLDVLPNRKKETLIAHFESLGSDFCQQIEVVSCDLWRPYIQVAEHCFPQAKVVIDRFHVVKALNDVLDQLRKSLRRRHSDEASYKDLRWKLFKRPEHCSEHDQVALKQALDKSWELSEVYALRNTFNALFDTATQESYLIGQLDLWIEHANNIGNKYLDRFVKTLQNWKQPIAAFASTGISNAVTEGLNNYLRYFKRIAFGLPNFEHMRLRILMATT